VLIGVGVALWASCFLGAVLDRRDTGTLATSLELWSMTWLAVLFLMSVPLLAAEAATGFGLLLPTIAPRLRGAALAGCVGIRRWLLFRGWARRL